MRRPVLLALAGALGVVLATLWLSLDMRDYLKQPRAATSASPGLSPLVSRAVVLLKPGQKACQSPVTFYADTGRARIRARVPGKREPRMDVTFTADGVGAFIAPVPKFGVGVEGTVEIPMREPGEEGTGEFCWHNAGPGAIQLIGTNEGRSLTPLELTVDGKPRENEELELVLFERRDQPLQQRKQELLDRADSFTAGFIPDWLLWPIGLLFLGLPLVVAVLFGVSVFRAERGS